MKLTNLKYEAGCTSCQREAGGLMPHKCEMCFSLARKLSIFVQMSVKNKFTSGRRHGSRALSAAEASVAALTSVSHNDFFYIEHICKLLLI